MSASELPLIALCFTNRYSLCSFAPAGNARPVSLVSPLSSVLSVKAAGVSLVVLFPKLKRFL